jgi:hypothetical protein
MGKEMPLDRLTAKMPPSTAPKLEWPEHLYLYEDRFVVLCVGPSAPRMPANLRKPGLYLHLENETAQREAAKVLDAYLQADPPPPGVKTIGVPPAWWCLTGTD